MAVSDPQSPPAAEQQEAPGSVAQEVRKKLTGRELYDSIGRPKYIVAPMVDRSEFVSFLSRNGKLLPGCTLPAWRMLTRSFMPPNDPVPVLAYSPMYHARLFREQAGVRAQHFQPTRDVLDKKEKKDSSLFLDGNPTFDRPLIVQFCANDPDDLLEAAKHVAPYCDAVDLNLGCPQGIARKGHYGAFLQEDWPLIHRLINRLHTELPVPVTAKFRIQETKEKTLEYAQMILSAGASFLTVHGRRREQKGHNTGLADWSYIRYLRDNLPPETVIFANGNNLNHEDLERCLAATGADGVMSAEGNLSDPSIFSEPPAVGHEGREYWRGRNGKGGYRIDAVFRRYLDIIYKYVLEVPVPDRKPLYLPGEEESKTAHTADQQTVVEGEEGEEEEGPPKKKQRRERYKRPASPSQAVMQGHLFQLLRPMIGQYTNVRDALARSRPGDMLAFEHVLALVEQAVREGLQAYEADPASFDEQFAGQQAESLTGSKATIALYSRPFFICQPYIRPLPEEALENGALQPKKTRAAETKQDPIVSEPASETATPDRLVSG
ncbi:hypothetical protein ASPZODRAFT_69183 [Penicilliopsis zonata CBS 506.65]|uniref:tRNA-dihydrouridine(16/17) synthase [NAD(P)(+)] n=1 Tax=Penicilliopsis zonata CBS 506.65 TaxID=1073090 RepID=A0A1L9SFF2_9EURO|nr:hypothetical protein ASPZODRAFT_69183 [Penicilliopsis zonata CBS 506.65]OJJ45744.1 hypothetical protein ASPZODRAFT_69183 [Penicilliopsis zonata CBS 506.65]